MSKENKKCTCISDLREEIEKDDRYNDVEFSDTGMFGDIEKNFNNTVEKLPLRFSYNPVNKDGTIAKRRVKSFVGPNYCFNCGKSFNGRG